MDRINFNFINNSDELPGVKHGFLLILIYAVIALLITPVQLALSAIGPSIQPWLMLISFILSFGILLPISMKIWNVHSFDTKKVPLKDYLILFPGILGLAILVEGIVALIPMPDAVLEYFAKMVQMDLQGYLTVGIAAPILEELIFRGVVLKGFLKKYDPKMAIIWSAVIFGTAHLNPWQFVAAFGIGIVIGYLYWKTQSIWPGIFIHFVNNSFSFYLGHKAGDINVSFAEFVGGLSNYLALLGISLVICFFVGKYFIEKHTNIQTTHHEK